MAVPKLSTFSLLIFALGVFVPPAAACDPVPPVVRDLDLQSFYEDGAGSIVEPTRLEAHKAETAPLVEFLRTVTGLADKANQQRSLPTATAECGLAWLRGWAEGGAYLGNMATKQAEAQRRWDLAGIALAYIKLKRWAGEQDKATIEPWLKAITQRARAAFDDPGVKRNNHWYWLGLAEGAVAVATDDDAHWKAARAIAEDAARDITVDGTLPLEMARGGRALHYHAFALEPLAVLAELAASRGEDFYALNGGALHRLVAKTVEGLDDPTVFDRLAGVMQQRPVKPGAGWLELYRAHFPGKISKAPEQPSSHRWLGGDVSVLTQVLRKR